MNTTLKLFEKGQSVWYDNIERRLLENGEMAGMMERGEIRGVTSNPSIFMKAITKSTDYDKFRSERRRNFLCFSHRRYSSSNRPFHGCLPGEQRGRWFN